MIFLNKKGGDLEPNVEYPHILNNQDEIKKTPNIKKREKTENNINGITEINNNLQKESKLEYQRILNNQDEIKKKIEQDEIKKKIEQDDFGKTPLIALTNIVNKLDQTNNTQYHHVLSLEKSYERMKSTKLNHNKTNRTFITIIPKGTKYYKSFGYNPIITFNDTIMKKAPFMWFASEKNTSALYKKSGAAPPIVYTFNLKKDLKLINMNSDEFIEDFKKKINTIFADNEHIRNILFFPFGYISPILQNYYRLHLLHDIKYSSEEIFKRIKTKEYEIKLSQNKKNGIYKELLLRGKRISTMELDAFLMFMLIKLYPNYDGYISTNTDFNFHEEICLFKPYDKIKYSQIQNGGVIKSKNQTNINNDINNNPLLYNIEENLNLIIKLQKIFNNFVDNVIKNNVTNTYDEILNLTNFKPKLGNISNTRIIT
jgi:hypothetical protein